MEGSGGESQRSENLGTTTCEKKQMLDIISRVEINKIVNSWDVDE